MLVERDGEQERVELATLVPGDIVLVNGGDQIPVDGEVLDGKALIDQHRRDRRRRARDSEPR